MINVVHHMSILEHQSETCDISWTVLVKERNGTGGENHRVLVLSLLGLVDWGLHAHYALRARRLGRRTGHFVLGEVRILLHENAIFRWGRHLGSWIQPIGGVVYLGSEVIRIYVGRGLDNVSHTS